jgi:hypothetical protein
MGHQPDTPVPRRPNSPEISWFALVRSGSIG